MSRFNVEQDLRQLLSVALHEPKVREALRIIQSMNKQLISEEFAACMEVVARAIPIQEDSRVKSVVAPWGGDVEDEFVMTLNTRGNAVWQEVARSLERDNSVKTLDFMSPSVSLQEESSQAITQMLKTGSVVNLSLQVETATESAMLSLLSELHLGSLERFSFGAMHLDLTSDVLAAISRAIENSTRLKYLQIETIWGSHTDGGRQTDGRGLHSELEELADALARNTSLQEVSLPALWVDHASLERIQKRNREMHSMGIALAGVAKPSGGSGLKNFMIRSLVFQNFLPPHYTLADSLAKTGLATSQISNSEKVDTANIRNAPKQECSDKSSVAELSNVQKHFVLYRRVLIIQFKGDSNVIRNVVWGSSLAVDASNRGAVLQPPFGNGAIFLTEGVTEEHFEAMDRPLHTKDVCIWPEDENELLALMWQLEYDTRPKPMEKKRCNLITGPSTSGGSSSDPHLHSPQDTHFEDATNVTRVQAKGSNADSQTDFLSVENPSDAPHIQDGTNNRNSQSRLAYHGEPIHTPYDFVVSRTFIHVPFPDTSIAAALHRSTSAPPNF